VIQGCHAVPEESSSTARGGKHPEPPGLAAWLYQAAKSGLLRTSFAKIYFIK